METRQATSLISDKISPHSLGTLIEWKQEAIELFERMAERKVPTRWGH